MLQQQSQRMLDTERLILRELDSGDLDFVATMLEDPRVTRFYPKQYTRADAVGWIERQQERYKRDGYGLWLVMLRARASSGGAGRSPPSDGQRNPHA
jgi:RimJ/RimL family protein N-acetyltransferase